MSSAAPAGQFGEHQRPGALMSRDTQARHRGPLVAAAAAWSCVLLILAGTVPFVSREPAPAYSNTPASPGAATSTALSTATSTGSAGGNLTLVQADGFRVLIPVALPLLASVLVWLLLRRRRTGASASGPALVAARVIASLVLAGAVVGFLTFVIGIVAIPTGALLLAAAL